MNGEVIKSFLVGLGFGVDEASLTKFNKAIASAALRVTALYVSIKAAAAGIFLSISKISEGFEQMGYEYRIIAPAINKALQLRQALLAAYKAAGINIVKAVQQSVIFNFSLAKTKFALEAIYKSVGLKFLPMLTKQMDIFRAKIYANMPKIQSALERFVAFIFKAFEVTTILGSRVWSILGRVYEFFRKLDEATNGWSTTVAAFIIAWKALNLSFLLTPLGAVIAGITALIALYDDFKVWEEGGRSFFDWGKAIPVINAVTDAVQILVNAWRSLVDVVLDVVLSIQQLFSKDYSGAFGSLKEAGQSVLNFFSNLWTIIKGVTGGIDSFVKALGVTSIFGQPSTAATLNGFNQPQPLIPQSTGGVRQSISQETNILLQGSADATANGRAVAQEQSRVNFDMTRNLKGAVVG